MEAGWGLSIMKTEGPHSFMKYRLIYKSRKYHVLNIPTSMNFYSQAMERLEKIVRQIDNNELEIDVLAEKIKEANEIIAFCTEKLTKADHEVEKLLQERQQSKE